MPDISYRVQTLTTLVLAIPQIWFGPENLKWVKWS